MGSSVSTELVCHDTVAQCHSYCEKSECIFFDKCNGAEDKYVCMPVDPKFLMWLMVACFLVVLLCCSSLVACYICRAVRRAYMYQRDNADMREVHFHNPGRVHHIQYDAPKRYRNGPPPRY